MESQIGPDGKPCRACVSVEELMKRGRELARKMKGDSVEQGNSSEGSSTTSNNTSPVDGNGPSTSLAQQGCPADKDELGRATWTLLHTMSVYYPEKPTEVDQETARTFMNNLGRLYPCDFCAKDLRKDLIKDPPRVASRHELAEWMCRLHNRVNEKMGKPLFDCSKVFERWRDGWKDGSCDY